MPGAPRLSRIRYPGIPFPQAISGFVNGLNIRDAVDELAPGESPDLWNVTLDERGGFGSRLGLSKWNGTPYSGSDTTVAIFEWRKAGHVVTQAGAKLYLDSSTVAFKTFSTAARCGFAELGGFLFVIHPVDGLFKSDGTSGGTSVVATGPKGSTLAVWQGRLWAAGDGTSRLYFSEPADGTKWTPAATTLSGSTTLPTATVTVASTAGFDPAGSVTIGSDTVSYTGVTATTFTGCSGGSHVWPAGTAVTQGSNFNDLDEKDEEPLVCLKGASGQDILGAPGLLVFKLRSTYRVNDSNTGGYTTLDPEVGCASNAAAVGVAGRIYTISEAGIWWTDGRGPMRNEGDKLRPLWSDSELAFDHLALWCAGRRGQRVKFSVPTAGSTANNLALEHYPANNPEQSATVVGSDAVSCYATLTSNEDTLIGGSPTVPGQVYELSTGGTDDGAAIHAWYQTSWQPPYPESTSRIRAAMVEGRGDFTCYVRRDYSRAQGDARTVSIARGGFKWNAFVWNDGSLWGPDSYAGYSARLPSLGVFRAMSFRFEATTTSTTSAPGLTGANATPTVGAWGVYAIHLVVIPLTQL